MVYGGPLRTNTNGTLQVPGVRVLHQELRNIVGAHCGCWVGVDYSQTARGLVVSPYPLCRMSLGVHLRAPQPSPCHSVQLTVNLDFLCDITIGAADVTCAAFTHGLTSIPRIRAVMVLPRAVMTRIGPGPMQRLVNLDRIMSWVRDGDSGCGGSPDPPPSCGTLNQSVLEAFYAFTEDWAEALAAVQVSAPLLRPEAVASGLGASDRSQQLSGSGHVV